MSAGLTLARVVQTCSACPSQWDAWTTDGQYLYLRYRHGRGTVTPYAGPDPHQWDARVEPLAEFLVGDQLDGCIDLGEFCAWAGLTLAAGVVEEHRPGPMYVIELPDLSALSALYDVDPFTPRGEGAGWT